jgi:hypothetical protein
MGGQNWIGSRASTENFKARIWQKFGKPIGKSPKILKNSAKNRSPVTPLMGKIAASSPAARLEDSRVALGQAADLTLEHIGLNPISQK